MNKRMEMNRRSGLWRSQLLCLIVLLVTVFAGNRASAQTNEGAVVGVVTDSTRRGNPKCRRDADKRRYRPGAEGQVQRGRVLLLLPDQDWELYGQCVGSEL